jgi:hypothetical protein
MATHGMKTNSILKIEIKANKSKKNTKVFSGCADR